MLGLLQVHNIAKIALRDDYVFIDAVGKDNEDTHSKVNSWSYCKYTVALRVLILYY